MIKYAYVRHRNYLDHLKDKNRQNEIEKIEQELNIIEKRQRIANNCKKVRESVKQEKFVSLSRKSIRNENLNNANSRFKSSKYNSDRNTIDKPLKIPRNDINKDLIAPRINLKKKPKWALSAKEHIELVKKNDQDIEEFMDNLDFDKFVNNLENQVIKTDISDEDSVIVESDNKILDVHSVNSDKNDINNAIEPNNKFNESKILKIKLKESMIGRSNVSLDLDKLEKRDSDNIMDFNDSRVLAKYLMNTKMGLSRVHSKRSLAKIIEGQVRPLSFVHN